MDQPLLSAEYRQLNYDLHLREPTYGTTGRRYVDFVRQLARDYGARHLLDYGCGKQDLAKALGEEFDVRSFDPALPGLDQSPEPADLVACIDVLEHVEHPYLDRVLADLVRVTIKAALITIATRLALKTLADGTNCHRIVESPHWWLDRLAGYFRLIRSESPLSGNGVQAVVEPTLKLKGN
jgi:hypothetical protein